MHQRGSICFFTREELKVQDPHSEFKSVWPLKMLAQRTVKK
jgi:hypothetical protein